MESTNPLSINVNLLQTVQMNGNEVVFADDFQRDLACIIGRLRKNLTDLRRVDCNAVSLWLNSNMQLPIKPVVDRYALESRQV
jgi:hypothetical protein